MEKKKRNADSVPKVYVDDKKAPLIK